MNVAKTEEMGRFVDPMNPTPLILWLFSCFAFAALVPITAGAKEGEPIPLRGNPVVINEIFYHAPADLDALEFIELYNTSEETVSLEGWSFSKGVDYTFPEASTIAAGGYVVICRDADLLKEFYGIAADGVFTKSLDNNGETVTLVDAKGEKVESVKYAERKPWPMSADGGSASLERLCPWSPANIASNWVPSKLSPDAEKPSGSPGRANRQVAKQLPPIIESVTHAPAADSAKPNEPINVTALLAGKPKVLGVTLLYRVAEPGNEGEESRLRMVSKDGEHFTATIPGQAANRLIRFRVEAEGEAGDMRLFPHPNDARPALSVYVSDPVEVASIPVFHFFNVGDEAKRTGADYQTSLSQGGGRAWDRGFGPPREGFGPPPGDDRPGRFRPRGGFGGRRGFGGPSAPAVPLPLQGKSALIYVDPKDKQIQLFDFVNITQRKSGYKVRLHKDQPLFGMNSVNVLYERDESAMLNEALAYETYRLAGNATADAGYARVIIDGALAGVHLWFEQPNKNFLRRHKIDSGGNLYKLIWMGSHRPSIRTPEDKLSDRLDIVSRHEKKTNIHDGYLDLVEMIEALENTTDEAAMWGEIEKRFEVTQVLNYFAVNALLSHWDGYFNNYFLYHDVKGSGKWSMFPWDQDSTWTQRGMGDREGLYAMPLDFGAEGARPAGVRDAGNRTDFRGGGPRGFGGFGGRGGPGWWRDGGDISRPLLANPTFKKAYLKRLKTLAETVFTEERFGPKIDALQSSLDPEVRLRAETFQRDVDEELASFHRIMDALREHLKERRAFLLREIP